LVRSISIGEGSTPLFFHLRIKNSDR
jgi:hypothetical protein